MSSEQRAIKVVEYIEYKNTEAFLRDISYGGEYYKLFAKGEFAFRGHASNEYKLIPSALRLECKDKLNQIALSAENPETEFFQILKEDRILRDFYKQCDQKGLAIYNIDRIRNKILENVDNSSVMRSEPWLPKEYWPLAALAQHYGLPTRLLDWTHDIYVGLFFAVEDYLEGRTLPEGTDHIELWALNLAPLLYSSVSGLPLKLVQPQYYGNNNLIAQKGLFTLWQVTKTVKTENGRILIDIKTPINRKPLDQLLLESRIIQGDISMPYLYCFRLPMDSAKEIYKHIRTLGYDASRIYPGYEGAARSLMHDYFLKCDVVKNASVVLLAR